MNMAITAGCFFILQCIFLMDVSVADPLIDVSPSKISLGVTSTLDINCTFSLNNHPDMAGLISLVLSRANATGQNFQDLVTVTEFSPNSVNLLTQEKVAATGVHSQAGESYLSLTWQYPTAVQGGVYKCSAHGVDNIGYNVELTNISAVTVDEANLNDIFDKLQQLEMHQGTMEQTIANLESDKLSMEQAIQNLKNNTVFMKQTIQTLQNDKSSMEQEIQTLRNTISQLQSNVTALQKSVLDTNFFFLGSYKNSSYYVSNYAFTDINKSIDVCKSLGGQLAVVNDQSELTAIQNFLKSTTGITLVYISGSDEKTEGNWVLSDTDSPLPFMSWASGRPFTDSRGPQSNCLMLETGYSWSMADYYCHFDPPLDYHRFLCEI